MDEGVGGFASINAMQGYRPNPVVQYAIQLMRAQRADKALPAMPGPNPPTKIENARDYAGKYSSLTGGALELAAEGQRLFLLHKGRKVSLEAASLDTFTVRHRDFERFPLILSRADAKDPKSKVVEAAWGGDWYFNSRYSGPKKFDHPKEWDSYVGHYRNENPWVGSVRIMLRKGNLVMDGATPLEPGEGGVFYLRDDEHNPEWISFGEVVNGHCMRVKLSGEDLWRVMTA